MKELTIREKAKRYDKAFRIAQELYNDPNSSNVGKGYVCTIFPELKESEDERIRKDLIQWINEFPDTIWRGNYKKDVIAWLKKQGDKKSFDDLTQQETMDIAVAKCFEQDEQNPTDKIKPKFKVGDWITNGATKPAQISSIEDDMYYTHNGTIGGDIESMDKDYHLWTIADAKDGDVLVHNDCIFIFMGIKDGIVQAFEENLLDGMNPVSFGEPDKDKDYHPATEEQRRFLFQKIKENGYEWDAEKKKLKKIEQKFAWSEKDERERKHCIDLLNHPDMIRTTPTISNGCKEWLKSLK